MRKILLIVIAAILAVLSVRISGQTPSVNKPVTDSATMLRITHKIVDSLTEVIQKTLDKQTLIYLYVERGIGEGILGHPDSAIHDYNSALTLNPKLPEVYVYRSAQYQRQLNYGPGIADLQTAITLLQGNPARASTLYTYVSFIQRRLNNYAQALKADSAAIELNPNNGFAYISNGWTYFESKRYEKAIESFNAGIPLTRNVSAKATSENLAARGDARRFLKKYKDAINDYSQALEVNPDNRHARWNRASCYNNNGDYELADAEYTKTITYYTGDKANLAKLYNDRAQMEIAEQKYLQAFRDDSTAITYNLSYGPAYWGMADAHAQNGDLQLSVIWYAETMKYYTNKAALSSLNNNIANEDYFIGQYEQVIHSSNTAIGLNALAWSPYLNRGRAYLKLGKKDKAMDDFNKVLAMDTTKKSFEYAFALFYTGNPDETIRLMQDNAISTTNPAILISHYYNIACLYSLMNKPDEANTYLKKCIDGGYSKKYASIDPDLENIRDTRDFKAIMNTK
jgi:tetratricopeptide (TPR) repeat protein